MARSWCADKACTSNLAAASEAQSEARIEVVLVTVRFTTPLTKSAVRRAASWGPSLFLACKATSQVLPGCGSLRRSTSSPQRAKRRSAGMDTCASCAGKVPSTRVCIVCRQGAVDAHARLAAEPAATFGCERCAHTLVFKVGLGVLARVVQRILDDLEVQLVSHRVLRHQHLKAVR